MISIKERPGLGKRLNHLTTLGLLLCHLKTIRQSWTTLVVAITVNTIMTVFVNSLKDIVYSGSE